MKQNTFMHLAGTARRLTAGIVLGLALVSLAGCESTDSSAAPLSPEGSTALGTGPALPTLGALQSGLGLTEAQKTAVGQALAAWQADRGIQKEERGRFEGEPGPRAGGMMNFLADCSATLTTDQFVKLCDLLAERRESHMEQRGPAGRERGLRGEGRMERPRTMERRHDRRDRGGREPDGQADPGLDATQRKALREAMQTANRDLHELMKNQQAGSVNVNAVRTGASELVATLRTDLEAVLSAEQMEKMVTKSRERAQTMAGRRLEHLDGGIDAQVAMLARVLGLDEAGTAMVQGALESELPGLKSMLEGIQAGNLAFPDALADGISLKESTRTALLGVLTGDQATRLQALEQLHRGPRGMRIYL
jgi:Spy/CpxP family protein refolding chaperone